LKEIKFENYNYHSKKIILENLGLVLIKKLKIIGVNDKHSQQTKPYNKRK